MKLDNLKNQINSLEEECSDLKGRVGILEEQFVASSNKLVALKELQDTNQKAIELLTLVSQTTREKIKELFESVVTKALQFIHQDSDYKFELLFDRHGNTPKLSWLIKTPDMQEAHDLMTTRAGGSKDIVALALRFVLLEISQIPGFIFLDEPFKRLDNTETTDKAIEFVKEMQSKTNRQIIIITHKKEVINSVNNPIILTKQCSKNNEQKKEMNISKKLSQNNNIKKKRGRPKKEKK